MAKGVVYSMKLRASRKKENLAGLSLKMYPDSLIAITEKISEVSLQRWMNSGMAYRGEFSMQNILEHPSGVVESTLSQVVEASAPREYYLTKEQITSWLARASEKKISLPEALRQETYTLDSRGSGDIVCATTSPFRMRNTAGLSKKLDSNRYRALGNAVNVEVIAWIGSRIVNLESQINKDSPSKSE
jgi:hypothetical protein